MLLKSFSQAGLMATTPKKSGVLRGTKAEGAFKRRQGGKKRVLDYLLFLVA
jgi:hypothetical protein